MFLVGCHVVISHSTKILPQKKLHICPSSITIHHFRIQKEVLVWPPPQKLAGLMLFLLRVNFWVFNGINFVSHFIKLARWFKVIVGGQTNITAWQCHKPMKVSKQTTWVNHQVSWSGNASDFIQEVAGLNTGWGTDYPGWGSLWISLVPLEKCQDCTLNYAMTTSFHILTNSSFAFVQLFDTTVSELLRVKLKKLWTNKQTKMNEWIKQIKLIENNCWMCCDYPEFD